MFTFQFSVTIFIIVQLTFFPIIRCPLSDNCPGYCECLSDNNGKCVIKDNNSMCLLSWGRLSIEINDWSLVDSETFVMCRSLHFVSIHGKIEYLNSKLLHFPSHNITDLYIRNTMIKIISNESLQHFNNVKNVFITSNNLLTKLEKNSFVNLDQIYLLDLSNNAIRDLSTSFMSSLNNLKILKLNNNNLKRIKQDTFINLRELRILELRSNQIFKVDSLGFRGLVNLLNLQISYNFLVSFNHLDLLEMSSLNKIDLSHNRIELFILPSCPNSLKLINLSFNNISVVPIIERRRCFSLRKVIIKNNYIKECKDEGKKDIFDLMVCEDFEDKSLCIVGQSYIGTYTVMIVIALCLLTASFFVPYCLLRHQKRKPMEDADNKDKSTNKLFRWSSTRRSVNNNDDLFV